MKHTQNNKGFTLIEVVTALAIVCLALMGVLGVAQRSLRMQPMVKNKILAVNLAQEGVEVIRNIRDQNWKNHVDWRQGLGDGLEVSNACVEYNSTAIVAPCPDNKLSINSAGLFVHQAEKDTPFTRSINIDYATDIDGIEYMKVVSIVEWQEGKNQREEVVEEFLYDWWE